MYRPGRRARAPRHRDAGDTYPVVMRSRLWALGFIATAGVLFSGCTMSSPPPSSGCVPRVMVEPKVAAPGGTITLTSDTTCDDEPPRGGWAVIAAPVGSPQALASVTTDDEFDGSFRVTITLPTDFPAGEAYAGIDNWDYSFCSDDGSCASATGDFTVER